MHEPVDFPPEPWHLTGDMVVSLWRVPPDDLPRWRLPPTARPLIVRRRCTLLTFWVDYRPDGVLAYREFLIALAVRHERRLMGSTVAAWVDDERALAGGRALWGIPKQLGELTLRTGRGGTQGRLAAEGVPAVSVGFRDGPRLPCRLRARAQLVQQRPDGTTCRVPVRISGRPSAGRARTAAEPSSPLSFLNDHRPRLSIAVRGFRGTVGGH
ncbi:acetoacetate decarboxylase family protein [Streptomyces sp. Ru87]|uniref:acetoacetate decarboxylase family protein n=1 Tax=Streptomyces sp. Ru87 TaxID=2044307 RepID=UPI000BF34984|nr:acetoacetate decarboxylase family protein [Streptomyces sp. Ru87]PGH47575.1 acetoacetate decarboxylase [Streptomyces sp. Ru87]